MQHDNRPLSDAETRDIAITAAEGGVNYWAFVIGYDPLPWAEQDRFDGSFPFFTVVDRNDPDNPVSVTPDLIRLGWQRTLAAPDVNGGWAASLVVHLPEEDRTCEIDSTAADIIIQHAIFDDIVFG